MKTNTRGQLCPKKQPRELFTEWMCSIHPSVCFSLQVCPHVYLCVCLFVRLRVCPTDSRTIRNPNYQYIFGEFANITVTCQSLFGDYITVCNYKSPFVFLMDLHYVWWHGLYGKGLVTTAVVFELHTFEFLAHIEAQQINLFLAHFPSVKVLVQSRSATCGEEYWHADYCTLHWEADDNTQVTMEGNCKGNDSFCIQTGLLHCCTVGTSIEMHFYLHSLVPCTTFCIHYRVIMTRLMTVSSASAVLSAN